MTDIQTGQPSTDSNSTSEKQSPRRGYNPPIYRGATNIMPKDPPPLLYVDPDNVQVGGNHYKEMVFQPTEYIIKNGLNFVEGNVVKYVTRHRQKGGAEDLQKAIHYLQLLLKHEYGVE
jgi:hypothetical protein